MNISLIDSASEAGSESKANEDLVVETQRLCMVLDGATGLGEQRVSSYPSDAVWFVNAIATRLTETWLRENNFTRALTYAIDMCIEEYKNIAGVLPELAYELPSAGMVAAVVEEGVVRVYRLGDCDAYCKSEGRAKKLFGHSRLEALDKLSIEAIALELRQGKSPSQARESVMPMLRKHRSLLNMPGGYGALSLVRDSVNHMEVAELSEAQGATILLASDGFSAIEKYRNYTADDIFERCSKVGMSGIVNEIREVENDDADLLKFPRLKSHDDATALLAGIE
ncbi:MAG: hypothetical protein ABW096_14210 [Candidatus Thiodiazotropha sp.]